MLWAPKHVLLFFWVCAPKLWIEFELGFAKKKKKTSGIMTCGMNNLEIDRSLFSALMKSFVGDWAQSSN